MCMFLSGSHVCCSGKFDNTILSTQNNRNEGEAPTPGQKQQHGISEVIHRWWQKVSQKEMQENLQYSMSVGGRDYFMC